MPNLKVRRIYYTVRDIREIAEIPSHVLREWEKKYVMLRPSKSKSGRRLYRKRDLDIVLKIKMLKKAGYHDRKINEILMNPALKNVQKDEMMPRPQKKSQNLIAEINHDLNEILKLLDDR